jgi:hypothetical protein
MLKEKVVYGRNIRHFGDSRWCICNIGNVKGERWYIGELLAKVRERMVHIKIKLSACD